MATWSLAALLVALMLFAGMLEGPDADAHERWMAETEQSGAVVLW